MSANSERLRERAEASFTKAEAKAEADRQVMSGIAAEALAVDAKTARLRALRLEREAAEASSLRPAKRRSTAKAPA